MQSPWIKKFYNDKRDYIIKTHEIELPTATIDPRPPEYELDKKYEVVLVQDQNEMTGATTFYWIEESKQKIISPRFQTQQQAQYWMTHYAK